MSGVDRLPILGVLSPVSRVLVLATVGIALAGIVLDWVVGADPTVLFFVSGLGDPRPGLGRRPRDGAARRAEPDHRSAASSTRRSATSPS